MKSGRQFFERFNRILTRVSAVITPLIAIAGNLISVMALLIGVALALGKAILIFGFLCSPMAWRRC